MQACIQVVCVCMLYKLLLGHVSWSTTIDITADEYRVAQHVLSVGVSNISQACACACLYVCVCVLSLWNAKEITLKINKVYNNIKKIYNAPTQLTSLLV